jgi:hypothetical protein
MHRRAEWFFLHPILPFEELRVSGSTVRCGICGVPLTKMMSPDGLSCLRCDRMKRDVRQRAFARQKTAKMIAGIWDPMIGIHERDSVLGREPLDGWESVDRQLSVFHELCLLGRDAASPALRPSIDGFLRAFEDSNLAAKGHELVRATVASLTGAGVQVVGTPARSSGLKPSLLALDIGEA